MLHYGRGFGLITNPREGEMNRKGCVGNCRRYSVGVVNRITRRATVLVEDQHGLPYSDGKRYKKFYVPFGSLEAAE